LFLNSSGSSCTYISLETISKISTPPTTCCLSRQKTTQTSQQNRWYDDSGDVSAFEGLFALAGVGRGRRGGRRIAGAGSDALGVRDTRPLGGERAF
jgi:hypothetical protein